MGILLSSLKNSTLSRAAWLFLFAIRLLRLAFALSTEAGARPQGADLSYSKEIDFDSFALEKIPTGFVQICLARAKKSLG